MAKNYVKIDENRRFLDIGVSATSAEYSVPNIRPILTEYSAEYSVSVVHYNVIIVMEQFIFSVSLFFFHKCIISSNGLRYNT